MKNVQVLIIGAVGMALHEAIRRMPVDHGVEVICATEDMRQKYEEGMNKAFERPPIVIKATEHLPENPMYYGGTSPIDAIAKKGRKGKRRW